LQRIFAIVLDEVEGIEDPGSRSPPVGRSSSNRDRPSGPSTTAAPSIVKLVALIRSAAAAKRVARVESDGGAIPADDNSIAVKFDFVDPIGAERRL
jgi:hypothetical protein